MLGVDQTSGLGEDFDYADRNIGFFLAVPLLPFATCVISGAMYAMEALTRRLVENLKDFKKALSKFD